MTSRTFSGTRLGYSFSYVVYLRGTSRGQEDSVIRLVSGILDGRKNVFAFKAGIILQPLWGGLLPSAIPGRWEAAFLLPPIRPAPLFGAWAVGVGAGGPWLGGGAFCYLAPPPPPPPLLKTREPLGGAGSVTSKGGPGGGMVGGFPAIRALAGGVAFRRGEVPTGHCFGSLIPVCLKMALVGGRRRRFYVRRMEPNPAGLVL